MASSDARRNEAATLRHGVKKVPPGNDELDDLTLEMSGTCANPTYWLIDWLSLGLQSGSSSANLSS